MLSEQEQIDSDLNLFNEHRTWLRDQRHRTEVEWLNVFPEAKKRWGKVIRAEINIRLKYLKEALGKLKPETEKALLNNPIDSRWRDDLIKDHHDRQQKALEKNIRFWKEQLAFLGRIGRKPLPEKDNKIVITSGMIEKAKSYPIEQLVEVNKQGFTRCFAHKDSKPSAYCKKNFIHCFVCQKSWDTIQVLIERDNYTFREAVLKLQ